MNCGQITYSEDRLMDVISKAMDHNFPYKPKRNYKIYGLKDHISRLHILFSYPVVRSNKFLKGLADFFQNNGMQCKFVTSGYDESNTIFIGLRIDVRSNTTFACNLIKFIIFLHEGRVRDFDPKMSIPKCPFSIPVDMFSPISTRDLGETNLDDDSIDRVFPEVNHVINSSEDGDW